MICPLFGRRSRDLDRIFALQFERTVNRDNTVSLQNLRLQIEAVRWRASLAGCTVTVHQHLDGSFSLTHGPHRLGRYSAQGAALVDNKTRRGQLLVVQLKPDMSCATKTGHFSLLTTHPRLFLLVLGLPVPLEGRR